MELLCGSALRLRVFAVKGYFCDTLRRGEENTDLSIGAIACNDLRIGIQAQADKEREVILATAYEQAEKLRGQGDAEATRIYGEAYSPDPRFYRFLRTLESYKKVLDEKTTIILSADSELLRLLEKGQP